MLTYHTPADMPAPFANYSHAVEIPPGARLIVTSGQLAIDAAGVIPMGTRAQAELCFDNIEKILKAGDMTMEDVVRVNAYVTGREHMAPYMAARDARFSGAPPASTLMIVGGFTRAEFTVEIEVIAAK